MIVCNEISLLVLFLTVLKTSVNGFDEQIQQQGRCEEIKVPMCKKVGYNMTAMPNQFNHINQAEAQTEAEQFAPLLNTNCSSDLLFFLCSMYAPICIPDYGQPLPPCRAVCDRAKAGCEPIMKSHGFQWPPNLACDRVTGGVEQGLCMDSNPRPSNAPPRARERSSPPQMQKRRNEERVAEVEDNYFSDQKNASGLATNCFSTLYLFSLLLLCCLRVFS